MSMRVHVCDVLQFGKELSADEKALLDAEQKEKLQALQDAAQKVGETIAAS